jgi:hypothetical protein
MLVQLHALHALRCIWSTLHSAEASSCRSFFLQKPLCYPPLASAAIAHIALWRSCIS